MNSVSFCWMIGRQTDHQKSRRNGQSVDVSAVNDKQTCDVINLGLVIIDMGVLIRFFFHSTFMFITRTWQFLEAGIVLEMKRGQRKDEKRR
jgi:hypothetical protein